MNWVHTFMSFWTDSNMIYRRSHCLLSKHKRAHKSNNIKFITSWKISTGFCLDLWKSLACDLLYKLVWLCMLKHLIQNNNRTLAALSQIFRIDFKMCFIVFHVLADLYKCTDIAKKQKHDHFARSDDNSSSI